MKNVKTTTTIKMRHRTVALLLLILIAFSSASCNTMSEPAITENGASQVIDSAENKAEDKTENETEKATEIKNWHGAVEYDENMAKEIQNEYYSQIVPEEITRDPSKYEVQFIAKFADKYVVYIYDIHRDKGNMSAIDIGGFEFRYWRQNEIYVYESGVFTTLPEALEKNELSNDDLAAVNAHFIRLNIRRYKEIPTLLENERMCTEYIAVGIQPSYNDKTYTVSDFPELKGVTEINQANGVKQPGDIAVSLHIMVENYSEQDIIDALWKLYERDDVLYARAGYYGTIDESPNDTYYVNSQQWAIDKIKLPDAWDLITGSNTVRVGVIDSGIDVTHPDLAGRVNTTLSKSFLEGKSPLTDENYHGTFVAGIIGASTNNSLGIAGVCWNVELVSIKIVEEDDNWSNSNLSKAIEYAEANDIDILNISLRGIYDGNVLDAINNYSGLVVCSAGNGGGDISAYPYKQYPAAYDCNNLIVVGWSKEDDQRSIDSNYNSDMVDLFAPGENILSTYPISLCEATNCIEENLEKGYHSKSGTSYSTPMVAGVAALMLAKNSSYTNIQIKNKILDSVDTISGLSGFCVTGGRLNAHKAVCVHNSSNIQYTPTTAGSHIMTCVVCNYTKEIQHMYMYTSLNSIQHRVYCACGYSADESHNKITDSNKGEIYCTKCSYRLELWNIKDEHELQ